MQDPDLFCNYGRKLLNGCTNWCFFHDTSNTPHKFLVAIILQKKYFSESISFHLFTSPSQDLLPCMKCVGMNPSEQVQLFNHIGSHIYMLNSNKIFAQLKQNIW